MNQTVTEFLEEGHGIHEPCYYCGRMGCNEAMGPCPVRVRDVIRFEALGRLYRGEFVSICRASGLLICQDCGKEYYNHGVLVKNRSSSEYHDYSRITVLCNGQLVKL